CSEVSAPAAHLAERGPRANLNHPDRISTPERGDAVHAPSRNDQLDGSAYASEKVLARAEWEVEAVSDGQIVRNVIRTARIFRREIVVVLHLPVRNATLVEKVGNAIGVGQQARERVCDGKNAAGHAFLKRRLQGVI